MHIKNILFLAFLAPVHIFQASSICIRNAQKISSSNLMYIYKKPSTKIYTDSQTIKSSLNVETPYSASHSEELTDQKALEDMKKSPGKTLLTLLLYIGIKTLLTKK